MEENNEHRPPTDDAQQHEQLNTTLTDENILPAAKTITEAERSSTLNIQPLTPDMEVHHPHHVHHSKKWKDYLFEFLMLFLAVTLGFFVENQREHYIEGQREKQFIRSLINDMVADSIKLTSIIEIRTARATSLDSLKFLLNSGIRTTLTNTIYYIASTASRTSSFRFIPNDGTMQQLKNSGAFRLIRSRAVADSIANYDVSVRNALRQSDVEETIIHDYRQASSKIFNANIFDEMMDENSYVIRRPQGNPALPNFQPEDLQLWNYKMVSVKSINKAMRRDARLLLTQAKNLLSTLKKQYDLQ